LAPSTASTHLAQGLAARPSPTATVASVACRVPDRLAMRPPGRGPRWCRAPPAHTVRPVHAAVGETKCGAPVHLSLSRLNHWLPRAQAHPEVVQGTTEFHDQIADAFFPQADAVFHDATPLDTTIDLLDPQSTRVKRLVRPLLLRRKFLAAGFLGRHEDLHLG